MGILKLRAAVASIGIALQFAFLYGAAAQQSIILFNANPIKVFRGNEVPLDCGVLGVYTECSWELKHNSSTPPQTFKLDDVINGNYSTTENMKAASPAGGLTNQCGIIITSIISSQAGTWTCKVTASGTPLIASKTIILQTPPNPVSPAYYIGWAIFLGIATLLIIIVAIIITCLKKRKTKFSPNEHKPLQEEPQQQDNQNTI